MMLLYLALGVAGLLAVLLALRFLAGADTKALLTGLKWGLLLALLAGIGFLALTGRLGWAIAGLAGLTPWVARMIRLHGLYRMLRGLFGYARQAAPKNSPRPPRSEGTMSREEALQILGLTASAGPEQIREAHRRLMKDMHPDRGGSDYLASRINQARDALLNE